MLKKIKTYMENVHGFEGHKRAETGATTLCLEKIVCLTKAIENGETLPAVSMIHYLTNRIKLKKGRFGRIKKIKINKYNYDIAVPSFGKLGNWGDGNHRTFTHKITQTPQLIDTIPEEDWTMKKIPNQIKTDFSDIEITSNYSLVKTRPGKYNIPEELKSATKFPTPREISNFFEKRKDQKITYREIIDNLYK